MLTTLFGDCTWKICLTALLKLTVHNEHNFAEFDLLVMTSSNWLVWYTKKIVFRYNIQLLLKFRQSFEMDYDIFSCPLIFRSALPTVDKMYITRLSDV